jgi:hypothetical protein
MSSPANRYAFQVIPEDMHTGLIVFTLPTYLTHFFRWSSALPLSLSLQLAHFSLFFRIIPLRNISGVKRKAMNRVRLLHWGISGLSTFLYPVQSSSAFSDFRVCAMSRILNHPESFPAQLCPPGPIVHSPRNSCRMWRCRILALVIRYCSAHFYLTSWWASNQSMDCREGHLWQITMDSMYWNMARCGVPFSYWTHLNQETSS